MNKYAREKFTVGWKYEKDSLKRENKKS